MIRSMRIVHFSDWHFDLRPLPEADLYVCTGDMYDNYPVPDPRSRRDPRRFSYSDWTIDPGNEMRMQSQSLSEIRDMGGFRPLLGSPDAPIVCVRGNHDYIDLAPMFEGCNLVHEFVSNEAVELLGLRITGHRGIPWIHGTWNDEVPRDQLRARCEAMPPADLFLTHYPPLGVLDSSAAPGHVLLRSQVQHYGLEGMLGLMEERMGERGLHCFGHIHECGGFIHETGPGRVLGSEGPIHTFSNGSCNANVIEF